MPEIYKLNKLDPKNFDEKGKKRQKKKFFFLLCLN